MVKSASMSDFTSSVVSQAGKDCVASPAQNPNSCPADFGTLPNGGACPQSPGPTCVYGKGMCGCVPCVGDSGTGQQQEWLCEPFPQPQGCPEPRPLIGSACTQDGQSCAYGTVCGVIKQQPMLICQSGRWQSQPFAASCILRQCGK